MLQCHFCKKVVCTTCSNREAPGNTKSSSKVRICHVCKLNRMNKEGDAGANVIASKPKHFEKVINVQHDNATGTYNGLPTLWRQLLEMPSSMSQNEVDTSKYDPSVAPKEPSKRQMYIIQEKNAEGAYMISAPQRAEKAFAVKFDYA